MLCDRTIATLATSYDLIVPFHSEQLQPCSYDLTLYPKVKVFRFGNETEDLRGVYHNDSYITAFDKELHNLHYETVDLDSEFCEDLCEEHVFKLDPDEFIIASTNEVINIPAKMAARFEGKSSLGRLGLSTHVTAGFIDAGFSGQITLEIKNVNHFPIWIKSGMRIGQICFFDLDMNARNPYGSKALDSHYQNQMGPTVARD